MKRKTVNRARDALIIAGDTSKITGKAMRDVSKVVPCPGLKMGSKVLTTVGNSFINSADNVCPRSIEIATRKCKT